MKIAVRLDDITPDMDWGRFFAFKELLDRYRVKPLIGVVPDNRDENLSGQENREHPEFWSYISQLEKEGWVIAMHGYRHLYSTKKGGLFPLNHFSEFAGVSYDKQLEMLKKGKALLEEKGICTGIFMAPAHSYDKNTVKALKQAGFYAMTDGFGKYPYKWQEMIFYPISFRLSKSFQTKSGFSTMVVHPATVSETDILRYEAYFRNPAVEWISFGEYLRLTPKERGLAGRVTEYGKALMKHFLIKLK